MFANVINWFVNFLSEPGRRRWWIRLLLFFLIVFPLALFVVFQYRTFYQESTDVEISRKDTTAQLAAMLLHEKFDHLTDVGVSLAARIRFRELIAEGKWNEALLFLKGVLTDFPFFERVTLADPNGTITADIVEPSDVIGKNFAFRDWYQGVSKEWKPYISDIFKSAAAPYYNNVILAVPIKDENQKTLGILILQIKTEVLVGWSKDITVGPSGFVYFVDNAGHAVGHPEHPPDAEIADFSNKPYVKSAMQGEIGAEVLFDPVDGKEEIVAYRPISDYEWGVVVEQPADIAFLVRDRGLNRIILVSSFIFLLLFLAAYLILRIIAAINNYRQKEKIFLDSIGDGVAAIDREWNITLFNKAAARISGWPQEEVMGKPFRNFIKFLRERDRTENIVFIEEAILFGKPRQMEDKTVLITKNGREIPAGDSAAPVFDQNGKVSGAIIIFRDATQERESQMLRSDFAYAAHQLRTPITSALYSLELALGEKELPVIKESMKIAHQGVRNVGRLVEQVLEVSKIDQRRVVPEFAPVKVLEICDEILKLAEEIAKRQNVVLTASPISGALGITTDRKILCKALLQILENAIYYSRPGGEVKLNVRFQENNVLFEIEDSGIGIPEIQQALVFVKFFRGSNIPPEVIGAGLGLYLAREYVKLLKGNIWFKSEENKGTVFSILIPSQ